jgi:hypothetical protein
MSSHFKKINLIPNYIAHNSPLIIPSFNKWKNHYERELDDMYCIFIDNMKIYFPDSDIIKDEYFNLFCNMIYKSSTKNLM